MCRLFPPRLTKYEANGSPVLGLPYSSIGIKDFIDDIKQATSRMEKLSDYSVSIIIFDDYGFHTEYESMSHGKIGPGLTSLLDKNENWWKRIVLYTYNKTLPKGIPYTHRKD